MTKRAPYLEKSGIDLIEETTHVLRKTPVSSLFLYYTGALPFILGLLYFWSDMSRNAYAYRYCAAASFILAFLFIWMKCWHAVYAIHMKTRISNQERAQWSFLRIYRLIIAQMIIQPTGFLILPLSLITVLGFGWAFAFYQNMSSMDVEEPLAIKTVIVHSMEQAKRWPVQNHIILVVYFLFGLFVFLNIAVAILILPLILKKFLGLDTIFTLSASSMFNTTFIAIALGMTYLCIDPLIKITYTLRCFYGDSITSGDDLRADLKNIRFIKKAVSFILILFLFLPSLTYLSANELRQTSHLTVSGIPPEKLDHSIQEVLKRREFSWRMPREKIHKEESEPFNPFTALIKWIKPYLKKITTPIKNILKKIMDWLKDLLPENESKPAKTNLNWMTKPQTLFFILLCIVVCILVITLRRLWLRKNVSADTEPAARIEPSPDLMDDSVSADDLPVDRWLNLAKELTQKGSFRLALRALYLAILAFLAQQEMISIAKYKSNRDYVTELERRAHEKTNLIQLFSGCVNHFDKAWYGMSNVTMKDVDSFSSTYNRIASFARQQ